VTREALERIDRAAALPAAWDELANSYFQRRAFLMHCECHNPCRQRYYLFPSRDHPEAGAIVYSLRLDLLTFARIRSPLTMHIVGVPCSVSSSGLVGSSDRLTALLASLCQLELGLLICLNLDHLPGVHGMVPARTLPTVEIGIGFSDWNAYIDALRSPYRRRLSLALRESERLTVQESSCCDFTPAHHSLYDQVYSHSGGRLEHLSCEFFQTLPAKFVLTSFSEDGRVLGWTITLRDADRWAFFLGGRDYAATAGRPLYFAMLAAILRAAIDGGARALDLGQTAEVPKLRLGGILREKRMLGYSVHPLLRTLLRLGRGFLSYRRQIPAAHVFRSDC
jgi:hypothetical protein